MKAFPTLVDKQNEDGRWYEAREEGMDLRDYFAAKAMQALIHSHSDAYFNKNDSFNQEENVRLSYEIANKMMEARND